MATMRTIQARYSGTCALCCEPITAGETVLYDGRRVHHPACVERTESLRAMAREALEAAPAEALGALAMERLRTGERSTVLLGERGPIDGGDGLDNDILTAVYMAGRDHGCAGIRTHRSGITQWAVAAR